MSTPFLNRFQRVSRSTAYLPEVDGLRFLALFLVVVVLHVLHYIDLVFFKHTLIRDPYWQNFITEGGNGVGLFFVLSGFILSLPFARWRLAGGEPVQLKGYYLRRLTRLEPPYLVALFLFFAAHVWLLRTGTFSELLPHLAASAVYLHGPVYGTFSPILPIAWSLEVEVQFYLLAPLLCGIFLLRNSFMRRGILVAVSLFGSIYWFNDWSLANVFNSIEFFALGLLLSDLYVSGYRLVKAEKWGFALGITALLLFLFVDSIHSMGGYLLKFWSMALLCYTVLTNELMKRVFTTRVLALIGGMCYSAYLLHFGIISCLGLLLTRAGAPVSDPDWAPIILLGMTGVILLATALFFLWVEKPFMKWNVKKKLSGSSSEV